MSSPGLARLSVTVAVAPRRCRSRLHTTARAGKHVLDDGLAQRLSLGSSIGYLPSKHAVHSRDAIAAAGTTPDRVFTDTASGRAGSNRSGWTGCMAWLREGDQLVVVAVDRLGRSVREVATALHELTTRGIQVRLLREAVDTSTPTGRAVTSIMASIAELELELGKERRAASREARVARGLAATKPIKLDPAQQKRLLRLCQQGVANNSLLLLAHGESQTKGVKTECADESADAGFLAVAAASGRPCPGCERCEPRSDPSRRCSAEGRRRSSD